MAQPEPSQRAGPALNTGWPWPTAVHGWLRTEDGGPRTVDRGPRTEDRGLRTVDRGLRTVDRGPWTEDRGPRTEDHHSHNQHRVAVAVKAIFMSDSLAIRGKNLLAA